MIHIDFLNEWNDENDANGDPESITMFGAFCMWSVKEKQLGFGILFAGVGIGITIGAAND